MTKLLNFITKVPINNEEEQDDILRFLHLGLLSFSYAPDRYEYSEIDSSKNKNPSFYDLSREILPLIKDRFLIDFYIDRPERQKIINYVPLKRLILVHGLSGIGKTVLLLKLCQTINRKKDFRAHYFDFKSINSEKTNSTNENLILEFRRIIYNTLKSKYIDNSEFMIHEWLKFKIINDPEYSEIKELIIDVYQRPLIDNDWVEITRKPQVVDKIFEIDHHLSLTNLLKFIKQTINLVLCFDNVDRLSLDEQSVFLEEAIDMSNKVQIPIILSLRTSNLRRISKDGANSDFVFIEKLKQLDDIKVEVIEIVRAHQNKSKKSNSNYSISGLLKKRMDFIRNNSHKFNLQNYYTELNKKYKWKFEPYDYFNRFWEIFNTLIKTFFNEDLYQYCNYNIREILIFYFNFINSLILEQDKYYSFERLIPQDKDESITLLRNYLYKWIVCGESKLPPDKVKIPNIFDNSNNGSFLLELKILVYLQNHKKNAEGVDFSTLSKDFWSLGYDMPVLRKTLEELTINQYFCGTGQVWVDHKINQKTNYLTEDSKIFLLPSGKYFVEKLAISRDYVFWMVLATDFSDVEAANLIPEKKFDYELIYDDYFKTEVVYNFITKILLPKYKNEIYDFIENRVVPETWKESKYDFLSKFYFVNRSSYIKVLINSIISSIKYSNISKEDMRELHLKYVRIKEEFELFENQMKKNCL